MVPEKELDDSFPKGPLLIKVFYDIFRRDRKASGGGILFYVGEDIPAKLLSVEALQTENVFIEISLREKMVCFLFL